jgi:hypothetical protein
MLLDREILHAIDDRTPRVGPLSPAEKYRDPKVTAECSKCGLLKLKRYLVEGRFGPECRLVCGSAPDEFGARDVRTEASIDALHLPHETLRSKLAKFSESRESRVLLAPVVDSKIINTCRCCGRADTHETWSTLKLLSAKDVTDEGVTTHEEMRNCVCGSTRMVVSDREGLVYYRGGGQ